MILEKYLLPGKRWEKLIRNCMQNVIPFRKKKKKQKKLCQKIWMKFVVGENYKYEQQCLCVMDLCTPFFANMEIAFKHILKIRMHTRCRNLKALKSKIKINKNL